MKRCFAIKKYLFTFILSSLYSSVKKHILLSKEATPQPFFIWRIWSSIFSPLSYVSYVLLSKNMSFCQKEVTPQTILYLAYMVR